MVLLETDCMVCGVGQVLDILQPEEIPKSITDPENVATHFINNGWQVSTCLYKTNAKSKAGEVCVDGDTLAFLGALRKAMVFQLFECGRCGDKDIHMQSFGSDNLTSDFDVTLVGRNACHVMWIIFDAFIHRYKSTLPYSFDTNLYSTGTNAVGKSRPGAPAGLERVPFISREEVPMFALRPEEGSTGEAVSLTWAIAKVIEGLSSSGSNVNPDKVFGSENVRKAKQRLTRAQGMRTAASHVTSAHYMLPEDSCRIITEYALQFHFASLLNDAFYEDADTKAPNMYLEQVAKMVSKERWNEESIIDCLCLSMYFSMEAAWTCATINVVVLEMQGGRLAMGSGTKNDYICAMIETYADFVTHAETGNTSAANPANVLKLSKYIYRMLYAAAEATAKTHGGSEGAALIRQEAQLIKAGVVDLRGETVELANLELVYLEPGATPDQYRDAVTRRFATLHGALFSESYGGGSGQNSTLGVSNIALLFTTAVVAILPRY
jgi:hypothetical protein